MAPKYTDEEVLEEIRRVSRQYCNGDTPTHKEFREHGNMSSRMPADKFGSWNESVKKAGLKTNVEYGLSKDTFRKAIKSVSEEYCGGFAPTYKEFQKHSKHSSSTVVKKFGSWNDALQGAGFEINIRMNTPLDRLSEDIRRVAEEYCDGEAPTLNDIEMYGEYPAITYRKRFGGWFDALSSSGFKPGYSDEWPLSGEDHPFWKGGFEQYYGESWYSQRKLALERDEYSCQICFQGKEENGRNPSVHHIKPKEEWNVEEEHEEMNALNNLISLCCKHHRLLEARFVDENAEGFIEKSEVFLDGQ